MYYRLPAATSTELATKGFFNDFEPEVISNSCLPFSLSLSVSLCVKLYFLCFGQRCFCTLLYVFIVMQCKGKFVLPI